MAEHEGPTQGPMMSGMDKPPSPNVIYDGGNARSPHEPQPVPQDEQVAASLAAEREQAISLLHAHRTELEVQSGYHQSEIARAERVIEACNRALATLDGSSDQPPMQEIPRLRRPIHDNPQA